VTETQIAKAFKKDKKALMHKMQRLQALHAGKVAHVQAISEAFTYKARLLGIEYEQAQAAALDEEKGKLLHIMPEVDVFIEEMAAPDKPEVPDEDEEE
jgi:hypothetical protein